MDEIKIRGVDDGYGAMGGLGGILIGALLAGNGGLFGNRAIGAGVVAESAALNPAFGALQTQISTLQNEVGQNQTNAQLSDMQTNFNNGYVAVNNGIRDNANIYLQGQAALQTAQAAGNFTTLQSLNGLGANITAQNNQNALQQLNSFNQLSTTTLQSFNELSRDNATGFNQIIAGQNAQNAQMAACCCDIKQAIREDGQATRALISDLNVQSLTAQLNDAKMQISNAQQTAQLEQFIATHPRPVVV